MSAEKLDALSTSRRMRVAVCATMPANTYSGGRYYALMLAEALAQGGHEVHFVVNQMPVFFPDMALYPQHASIRVSKSADFRSGMPEGDFDFVFLIPAASFAGYYARVELFAIERGAHLVFVNFESGDWFNSLSPSPRPLSDWAPWKRAVEGASVVLSISAEGNKWAEKFYQQHPAHTRFEYCYPPVNTLAADSAQGVEREERILIFMRFSTARHKGSESFGEMFCKAMRGYTLVFVLGKEDVPAQTLDELTSLSRKFGVKLEFKPRLSDVEKFREIKRARLVLFPSLFEGYGYPPVEALYCGTACVAFRLPVLEETCGDKVFYAAHGDWSGFRGQIEVALTRPLESDTLRDRVRIIAPLDTATAALEDILGQVLQAGPAPAQERERRRTWLAFQERWHLNDLRLRLRARRHKLRRRVSEFLPRQLKRLRSLLGRRRRVSQFVARQVTRMRGASGKKRSRAIAFLARQVKRRRARAKAHHRVCYYPVFDSPAELTSHWHRAKWYLPFVSGICEEVLFPVRAGVTVGPAPDYMCDTPADKKHLKLRPGRWFSVLRAALRADVILVWKNGYTSPLLEFLGPLCGIPIVNVATDDLSSREYGAYCSLLWKHLTLPLDRSLTLSKHRQRFCAVAKRLREQNFERACVFGTSPSLETAEDFEYGNAFKVVCNSIVQNKALLDYIQPHFICAGDVVSHLGVSTYADRFRSDLIAVLRAREVYFLTTSDFGALFLHHHPELADKVFLVDQTMKGPNYDWCVHYGAPRLDSTLNIHMLPLAATFAKEIWLLGCDGKSEVRNNEDFWAHAKQAQYHDLVNTGHLCHPTFDVHRQASTYDRFLTSTATTVETGEQLHGMSYGALVPSNIPVLKLRSIQPDAIAAVGLSKPYPLDELRKLLPRPPSASAAPAKATNGSALLPFKSAISKCEFNRKNVLVVTGWALSPKPLNRIEIWIENQFIGIANLRMHRNDIALKFPEYHEADSGYQFFGEAIRPDGARVSTRIRMYSDNSLLHEEIVVPKDN